MSEFMIFPKRQCTGFTLVEVMVTLAIVSIGMLALGAFYASMVKSEGISQERLAAVHMAEQLIESWQKANIAPTPDCTLLKGAPAPQLVVGSTLFDCRPTTGVPVLFDIAINEVDAKAPLPPEHPNNPNDPNAFLADQNVMGALLTVPADGGTAPV